MKKKTKKRKKPAVQATLKFDLTTSEGKMEHKFAVKAYTYYQALVEVADNIFRQRRKYGTAKGGMYDIYELEKDFYELMEAHKIDIHGEEEV